VKEPFSRLLEAALGKRIERWVRVSGGDINDAYQVTLVGGERVFVKTHAEAPRGLFAAEAKGLKWLAEAKALKVPEVLSVGDFLALRWLEQGTPSAHFDEQLGQGIAQLHRVTCHRCGFDSDNFIGRLAQRNRTWPTFVEFYRHERIEPQFELALAQGHFDSAFQRELGRVLERLPEFIGQEVSPSRLHGDLWNGNVLVGPDGEPWLIDPAVYAGDREIDLAMMRLFGGFSERVFRAYVEAFPLRAGHEDRLPLYQLYPLLVHVNLFGGSYVGRVRSIVQRYR
jgi:fructosamine-3-kinase